jgi:hypothetical protein
MKDYIWVVEVDLGGGYAPIHFELNRSEARKRARCTRRAGIDVRVRKSVRSGK